MRNFRLRKKSFDAEKAFVGFDLSIRVDFQITVFQDLEIVGRPAGATN